MQLRLPPCHPSPLPPPPPPQTKHSVASGGPSVTISLNFEGLDLDPCTDSATPPSSISVLDSMSHNLDKVPNPHPSFNLPAQYFTIIKDAQRESRLRTLVFTWRNSRNRVGALPALTRVLNMCEDSENNPPVSVQLLAPDYSTTRVREVLYLAYLPSNEDAEDYLPSLAVQKDPSAQINV
jgi:hypothetical protein